MAITLAQTRYFLNMLPEADSNFSAFDCGLLMSVYTGELIMQKGISGGLTPSGALTRALTAFRGVAGGFTPTGQANKLEYKALAGALTPTGAATFTMYYSESLSGGLTLAGALTGANPAWQLLDEVLAWLGDWDSTYSYTIHDTVLYQTASTAAWHVFVSKTEHNVGNIPTTSPANWRRLYQEQWL